MKVLIFDKTEKSNQQMRVAGLTGLFGDLTPGNYDCSSLYEGMVVRFADQVRQPFLAFAPT